MTFSEVDLSTTITENEDSQMDVFSAFCCWTSQKMPNNAGTLDKVATHSRRHTGVL